MSETIGERVRRLREERRLSATQLGASTGIGSGAILKIERGESKQPSFTVGVRLARALGVSPAELAGERAPGPARERDDAWEDEPGTNPTSQHANRVERASPPQYDDLFPEGEQAPWAAAVAELRRELGETNRDLGEVQEQIAALEGDQLARSRAPRLGELIDELIPLLEDFVNGRGEANTLEPRIAAMRAIAERDRGGAG